MPVKVTSCDHDTILGNMEENERSLFRQAVVVIRGDGFVVHTIVGLFREKGYEVQPLNVNHKVNIGSVYGEELDLRLSYYRVIRGTQNFVLCFFESASDLGSRGLERTFFIVSKNTGLWTGSELVENYQLQQ